MSRRPTLDRVKVFWLVAVVALPARAAAQGSLPSLDSLLNTRINAAAKYAQTADEAAASVTILTSDEIERAGYTNLGEALETVRGLYASHDRNYAYLGTRGFSRPSDYNNRILVLVDGHTLNEGVWGSAQVGEDLSLDLDAIERIEIVRGPGSVLYGTSAMFGVINVVTKSAAALDGVTVSARVATVGQRQFSLAAGHALGDRTSIVVSGTVTRTEGQDLYLPEFDDPTTNGGVANHVDGGLAAGAVATLAHGDLRVRAGVLSHEKRVPTGTFGNAFNDPRTDRLDRSAWIDVSRSTQVSPRFRTTMRAYGDLYLYDGHSAYHADSIFLDRGDSRIAGAELLGVWESSSRNRLTMGGEYRGVLQARYREVFADGTVTEDDAPNAIHSLFIQDEYQLSPRVKAVGGWRVDHNRLHGTNTAPRAALIVTPSSSTTIKALYGEAFRAPSPAEADLQTAFYGANPDVRAERIRTSELALTQRVSDRLLVGGSLYHYHLRDLIDQVEFNDEGQIEYRNTASAEGAGAELELDYRPAERLQLRGAYAYQFLAEDDDGVRLSNAPEHVAMASATWTGASLNSTFAVRHEAGRRTYDGSSTRAFVRADAHVGTDRALFAGAQAGVRVTNLLNTAYATPVGIEHLGPSMPQLGRRVSLELSWRF